MSKDIIDRIVREASQVWPDYDDSSLEVVLRMVRAFHFINQELVRGQADYGISPAECGVLIELRLAGPPYKMTPTQLYNRLLVTSGGMTGRTDRLEKLGLLCRLPDPQDRRSIQVQLTENGYELIQSAGQTHFRVMERLTQGFTSEERESLAGLLRKLLFDIESPREK